MSVSELSTPTVILSSQEKLLVDTLDAAFGTEFSIVDIGPDQGNEHEGLSLENLSEVIQCLNVRSRHIVATSRNEGITVAELPGQECLACVSSRQGRLIKTAAGIVQGMNPDNVLRVATFAARTAKERDTADRTAGQLEAYAEQVTSCFEELVWLRELSQQIEQCDVTRDVGSVAETVLPALARLTNSESVALLSLDGEFQAPTATRPVNVTRRAGREQPLDEVLIAIARRFGEQACKTPVVVNQFQQDDAVFNRFNVRSLIVMAIQQEGHLHGWLMAINREPITLPENHRYINEELGLGEYGTIEAGLMQSACTLLATHAHNVELFVEKEQLAIGTVKSLVRSLEARDAYTKGHSDRVAGVALVLAEAVGYSEEQLKKLHLTGILHDVGKIGIPDHVLNKPDRLTDEEFDLIKQHPTIGHEILLPVKSLSYVLDGVLHHHENFDGTGYPHGLVGMEIPLDARILAVADSFDAMTSNRPYRNGMPFEKAQAILKDGSGTQWDPTIVDAFFANFDKIQAVVACHKVSNAHVESIVPVTTGK
tara:strand:+ start:58552 stop:60171 length:1620 start_codon:yes stop_codon:yes gene_type:complete